ncbi:MAG TPA: PAAR domain-containing protein [Burkholderiales bacterium]|nr:PAAR domain-containing protein [Burkholderiales bacterium]
MPAAARVTDVTNHGGTIIGPGVATVLVGGMPAAVAGDMHVCPMGSPAHPPSSPFPMGSGTVLVGGRPVLRTTDACACGAMAAVGAPTVMIGG